MNRMKIFAAAAGFALAAGITTAGNIVINSGEISGTYSTIEVAGDGTVTVHGFTDGSGTSGPVASFTGTCDLLSCSFNGSGSSGSITSYSWDLGDGTAKSGSSITHTYAAAGSYSVTLTVSDGTDSHSSTKTFSVSESGTGGGGGTGDCSGFTPPFPGSTTSWTNFLSSLSGGPLRFTVDRNTYLSVPFTAPVANRAVKGVWDIDTHAANPGSTFAISGCEGDFGDHLPNDNVKACRVFASAGTIYLSTDSDTGGQTCELQSGSKYFLNIVYAKGTRNDLTSTCTDWSRCGAHFVWYDVSYLL